MGDHTLVANANGFEGTAHVHVTQRGQVANLRIVLTSRSATRGALPYWLGSEYQLSYGQQVAEAGFLPTDRVTGVDGAALNAWLASASAQREAATTAQPRGHWLRVTRNAQAMWLWHPTVR